MKFLCATILLGAGLLGTARAQPEADDKYIGIYDLIQQADHLATTGEPSEALAAFGDAQRQLQAFQKDFPNWNPNIVSFRQDHIAEQMAELKSHVDMVVSARKFVQTATNVPVAAAPSASAQLTAELDNLRAQLQVEQAANATLQARLREALAAQPAAVDPRELQKAQEKTRSLMKQIDLLNVSRGASPPPLATTQFITNVVTVYVTNASAVSVTNYARVPVVDTNALERAQVVALEKIALQNKLYRLQQGLTATNAAVNTADDEARIRELTQERDRLMEKLDQANHRNAGGKNAVAAMQLSALNDEVTVLRSRLAVDEAAPIPFTPEEQALFKAPVTPPTNPDGEKKSLAEMPAGTAELVASAQAHFARQEFDAAEADYQKILDRDQNNGIALANLATIELQQGKLDAAGKHIRAALAQSPNDAYNLCTLGYLKFRQEKYEDALNALSRAAQLDPNNPEIQNYLGLTMSQQGQRKAAEAALRRAIELNPNYAPAHNNLAVIYLSQTPPLPDLARWHYQKALAAGQPRNPDLEKMLADKGAPVAP